MWSKYYLARPVARYPACVYLPLSPDETAWGEQPTVMNQQPAASSQIRAEGADQGSLREADLSSRRDCPQQ